MNLCMLKGIVIEEVDFKFIINKIHDAISIFKLQLPDDNVVTIKAFDKWADYCYSKLTKGDIIGIQGYLGINQEIIIEEIEFNY